MQNLKETAPSRHIWWLPVAVAVIAASATTVIDFDIWWHMKTGELIWLWKMIPTADIFSYSAAGAPWVNHEWGYQMIVWGLFEKFGFAALTAIKVILTTGVVLCFYRTIQPLFRSKGVAMWIVMVLLISIADRITDRPSLFTTFFIALFCMEFHRFVRGEGRPLWLLPIIQVFWINLHGGGMLGPQIALAFAAGESLQHLFGGECLEWRRLRLLWIVALSLGAAALINPQGIDAFLFPLKHLKMDAILTFTQEWLPPLDARLDAIISQIAFRLILVATLLSFVINRNQARFSHLILTAFSCLMVTKGRRFTADFVLMNLPILIVNLRGMAGKIRWAPEEKNTRQWLSLTALIALSSALIINGYPATLRGGTCGDLGFGTNATFAPEKMVDFIEENGIRGRMFNEMGLGGYLIWRLWPGSRVFMDGRTPVYGDDLYREFVGAFQLGRNFEELDQKWQFDYLLFKADSAWNLRHVHQYLWGSKKWRLVYAGPDDGFIYVKDEPLFRDLISRHALKEHPLLEYMKRVEKIP